MLEANTDGGNARAEGYCFLFLDPVDLGKVAAATSAGFGVAPDGVETCIEGKTILAAAGMPVVLVQQYQDLDGGLVSFNAGVEFAEIAGRVQEVEVAARLCKALGVRAILAGEDVISDAVWMLVTADGSSGLVLVDEEDIFDGVFTLVGALQPIPGAPEVPVVELPEGFNPFRIHPNQ